MKKGHSCMKPCCLCYENETSYNTKKRYNYKRYKRNEKRIAQMKSTTSWLVKEYPDSDNCFNVCLIFRSFQPSDTDKSLIMNEIV